MIRHTLFFFLDLYFFYFHKNYLRLVGKHCDIDYARVVVKRYFSDFHLFLPPPVIQAVIKLSELIIKEIFHIRNKETSNKSVERSFTFFFFAKSIYVFTLQNLALLSYDLNDMFLHTEGLWKWCLCLRKKLKLLNRLQFPFKTADAR